MVVTALLACMPVILILFLIIRLKISAEWASLAAYALVILFALTWCKTAPVVLAQASLSGVVASLPVVLLMAASLFQIALMEEAGAIQRLAAQIKGIAPDKQAVQLMLVNVGLGIILTSFGAPPGALLPPIMLTLGYGAFASIALPSIGYQALGSYALLGMPLLLFAGLSGQTLPTVSLHFAVFMPLASLCITFGMLFLIGGYKTLREGFAPALIAGLIAGFFPILLAFTGMITLTGLFVGLGVMLALGIYLKLRKMPHYDASILTSEDWAAIRKFSLPCAISPWIIFIMISLLLNTPALPLFELTFARLAMPIELIPGAPEQIRIFWQPWFWIFISTLLSIPLLSLHRGQIKNSAAIALKRSCRPCLTALLFFALAYAMINSGKNADWQLPNIGMNMIQAFGIVASNLFGRLYPLVAPLIGLTGGFLSNSQTSSLAMFTWLHLTASDNFQQSSLLLAAAGGMGASMAGILSPAKVMMAASAINQPDSVPEVIKKALPLMLLVAVILGVFTFLVCLFLKIPSPASL